MKTAKVKIASSLFLAALIVLFAMVYVRSKETVFYIRNDTGLGALNVEIELNNEVILSDEITDFYIPDTVLSASTGFGFHSLRIRCKGLVREEQFISGISKYIVVEISKPVDSGLPRIHTHKSFNPIMFQ